MIFQSILHLSFVIAFVWRISNFDTTSLIAVSSQWPGRVQYESQKYLLEIGILNIIYIYLVHALKSCCPIRFDLKQNSTQNDFTEKIVASDTFQIQEANTKGRVI